MEELETLNEFRRINASFPYTEPIKRWKDQGGKVVGWMCSYVPEEIIHAAGILPIRLTGDSKELGLEESASYLSVGTCTFIRSCFELVLTHQFDFLDAFVTANTCEGTRHMAEVWAHYLPTPLLGILPVPRRFGKRALDLYHKELVTFKQVLEGFFGVNISDQALWQAIQVYDEGRNLVRDLYDLKKAEAPPISGAETLEVLNAAFRMPREDFNRLLRKLLAELRQSNRALHGSVRLMLSGSIINNSEFIQGIEDLGALVVVDELCTGTRYWYEPVGNRSGTTPLEALADRYLERKIPCARMVPSSRRSERVLQLANEFEVEGVISEVIRYCNPFLHDAPMLKDELEAAGFPVLGLEVEYGMGATGQVRTRAQAFIEMIKDRRE